MVNQSGAPGATGSQSAVAGSANGRGAPLSNVGAPGSPTGPSPLLASTASGTSGGASSGGSSSAGRVIPNLPASPNGARIVSIAQSQVGARYTWAGTSPSTGFDCSGFVYWVLNTVGYPMPRTMEDQLSSGRRVRLEELRPGDVVFFSDTYTSGLSHDGIYIGDGKFIHAVDESTGVAITPLNAAYWQERYVGAVRVMD
jgi:cell wall-associated NlpC family hydrolase